MTQYLHRFVKKTILCIAFTIAWTQSGMAQTQDVAANQESGAQNQSATEAGKQATNPLSSAWQMQIQQNNNWVGMPLNMGDLVQSNLLFQPLLNVQATNNWTLFMRPVLTLFNSTPLVNQSGHADRTTAFGDTILAFAVAPRPFFGGALTIGAGPTFIFPTATDHLIGQHTWQLGPDLGIVWSGKNYIAAVFNQQWFKIGGGGAKTNQLSTLWTFTYFFKNGWSIGTLPNFTVNWEAPRDQRLTFPIGPQIGKLAKFGRIPTLIQLQGVYYPIHPTHGPKWDIQLQITPTILRPIKGKIF